MELVDKMRMSRDNISDAREAIQTVIREESWNNVTFRTENGITELYILLEKCTGYDINTTHLDIRGTCEKLVRVYRNYVVYNDALMECLCGMIAQLVCMREHSFDADATTVDVLCGTIRDMMVPFCLYIYENLGAYSIGEVRRLFSEVVFSTEPIVMHQWPEWKSERELICEECEETCPITMEPVVDGIIASDGYLYERSALLKYMIDKRVSPMTREYLDVQFLPFTNAR